MSATSTAYERSTPVSPPLTGDNRAYRNLPPKAWVYRTTIPDFKNVYGWNREIQVWRPRRDSNPRYRRERAMSWAGLDDGDASGGYKQALILTATCAHCKGDSRRVSATSRAGFSASARLF